MLSCKRGTCRKLFCSRHCTSQQKILRSTSQASASAPASQPLEWFTDVMACNCREKAWSKNINLLKLAGASCKKMVHGVENEDRHNDGCKIQTVPIILVQEKVREFGVGHESVWTLVNNQQQSRWLERGEAGTANGSREQEQKLSVWLRERIESIQKKEQIVNCKGMQW